jgi:[histone H3]-lysine36 N-trimethyltransferase
VSDPRSISSKQERAVKKFVKEYFDKAVIKHREHEKQKSKHKPSNDLTIPAGSSGQNGTNAMDDEVKLTDDEADKGDEIELKREGSHDSDVLKRKRPSEIYDEATKKVKLEEESVPPPPPPPIDDDEMDGANGTEMELL